MRKIVALIALVSVGWQTARADDPAPMEPYKKNIGDDVFVMLPGQLSAGDWLVTSTLASESGQPYRASGLYRNDGSTVPLWTVEWYAAQTYITRDGRFLVRVNALPDHSGDLAVAFYDRGRLLREHLVLDLVSRPAELPRSVSHFQWLASAALNDAAKTFRVATLQQETYTFDITSGRTVRAREPRVASLREVFSMAEGDEVAVPEADLLIELLQLSYRRCPAGAVCVVADGPVVDFRVVEISTGTQVHRGELRRAAPSRFPFFVLPMNSDGETFARFLVHGAVDWCETRASRQDEQTCWSLLAEVTGQEAYCGRIAATGLSAQQCYQRVRVLPSRRANTPTE